DALPGPRPGRRATGCGRRHPCAPPCCREPAELRVRRVLIVSATAKRGGAERALAFLARRLPAFGWEPLVALLERGPLEQWLEGIDVRHIPKDSQAVDTVADLAAGFDVVLSNKWRSQLYGGPA